MNDRLMGALGRILRDTLRAGLRSLTGPTRRTPVSRTRSRRTASDHPAGRTSRGATYPGDFPGMPQVSYRPQRGAEPDPGEIVWTWVPYEEDHSRGKDRPVLLVGRDGAWLLAVQLTSRDHDRDARQEASSGRFWVDIGTGEWDEQRRPSEARVNRVVRVHPDAVRRVSVSLPRDRFDRVVAGMRRHLT